jgi:hypothetical protein
VGANRHANILRDQVPPQTMPTALRLADSTEKVHHPLSLRIRITLGIAVSSPHLPDGRMLQQGSTPGLVAHPCQHPTLHEVACRFTPHATPPSQETIIRVRRIIEAIGIGKEGPKDRTEFEELMPVFIGTCQATHFKSENQPHMVQADLSQQALKAQARHHTLATLALIVVNNDHAVSRPSHGDGSFDQGILPGCGLDVLGNLLGMGLTYIHHRLSP